MGDRSSIEWTDATWNPVRGCTRVSPGCGGPGPHGGCYAEVMAARFSKPGQWGHGFAEMRNGVARWTGKVALIESMLDRPLRWQQPRRIFVNSTADLFHEDLPEPDIITVLDAMMVANWHTYQILTKRPERMREIISRAIVTCWACQGDGCNYCGWHARRSWAGGPPPHVWLGTSTEDQERADERIPELLATPAAVRFISAEPLLGAIALRRWIAIDWQCSSCRQFFTGPHRSHCLACGSEGGWTGSHAFNGRHYPRGPIAPSQRGSGLDLVIVGGESGPRARPNWTPNVRSLVQQCKAAHVPVFVKQLGAYVTDRNDAGFDGCDSDGWPDMDPADIEHDIGQWRDDYQGAPVRVHLRDRKGGDISEWPEDLRVRELPG